MKPRLAAKPEPDRRIERALASGAFARRPHMWYERLQETRPVYWSPYLEQWLVTPYSLVEKVLLSPGAFSNFGFNGRSSPACPPLPTRRSACSGTTTTSRA